MRWALRDNFTRVEPTQVLGLKPMHLPKEELTSPSLASIQREVIGLTTVREAAHLSQCADGSNISFSKPAEKEVGLLSLFTGPNVNSCFCYGNPKLCL